jgi:wyosine [tRNA(Phe)-imidazoG37] synthetase (radical SAM superfamily)
MNTFTFGPVPSRRLGRSLGINNIPPKVCTYTCVYCQLGNTIKLTEERANFYSPDEIFQAASEAVAQAELSDEKIDYLTVVPDGEPTLDKNLFELVTKLKTLGKKVAIITNSTLIDDEDVRKALYEFDWVSLKVDIIDEITWRKFDRPFGKMKLQPIIDGMKIFAENYQNFLATETMLAKGENDDLDLITETADFIAELNPDCAYISIPTRPPAEESVMPPDNETLLAAYKLFSDKLPAAELNIAYEGNNFSIKENFKNDFLSIISVHPMRRDAVMKLLKKSGENFSVVSDLVEQGFVLEQKYNGEYFYLRNLRKK